ncbi:MAG: copper amine oxidase N-terminal domain-containing protein [Peptococcia bacterium]
MKKRHFLIMVIILSILISVPAYAEISVTINGDKLSFDVPPVIENGRTLVPVRVIFEALGAEVTYNAASKTVAALKGDTVIILKIGGGANVNGKNIDLDVPAKIVDGRTLVPLRFISESLGATVNYDPATQSVKIV